MINLCAICGLDSLKRVTDSKYGVEKNLYRCTTKGCTNTYALNFRPQGYQEDYINDDHFKKAMFAGVGTGKTRLVQSIVAVELMKLSGGHWACYAQTVKNSNEIQMPGIVANIPDDWITKYDRTSDNNSLFLINNSHIDVMPPGDPNKFKSHEYTGLYGEEIATTPYATFKEANARVRNTNGICYARNKSGGIKRKTEIINGEIVRTPIEEFSLLRCLHNANAAPGWIFNNIIKVADRFIYDDNYIPKVEELYDREEVLDKSLSVHFQVTQQNVFLPENYIDNTSGGMTEEEKQQLFLASFEFKYGLVFPNYKSCVISPIELGKEWPRMSAQDFGIGDATVNLIAALNPINGIVYITNEYYQVGLPIGDKIDQMGKVIGKGNASNILEFHKKHIPLGTRTLPIVGCNSGVNRNIETGNTIIDAYAELGLYIDPVPKGGKGVKIDRIGVIDTYMKEGRLKIFNNCTNLIRELSNYRWDVKSTDGDKGERINMQKLKDGDDHAIDTLIYLGTLLPSDPTKAKDVLIRQKNAELFEEDPLRLVGVEINDTMFSDTDEDGNYDDDGTSWLGL